MSVPLLQPRNVLIDIKGTVKLADFGLSSKLNDDQNTLYQSSAFGKDRSSVHLK